MDTLLILMDHRIEHLQYGLHSTQWVLGKDIHPSVVTPTEVYTPSQYCGIRHASTRCIYTRHF